MPADVIKKIQGCTQINLRNIPKNVIAGVVVALVSIPIAIGYAQIAGLPPVYGLYGSLLPILVYSLLTSSPQFVVGIDAAPAAIVGVGLATMGVESGSEEAMAVVPVITLLAAAWLLIFRLAKAGRVVNYISTPVMGGFISGIGFTIILMQVPKLFGGGAGTGELFELLYHIGKETVHFNGLSALLGVGTVIIILVSKRLAPKFPMPVVMMGVGGLLTACLHIDTYGVKLLPDIPAGLPHFVTPHLEAFSDHHPMELIMLGLSVALVIMAQTLLATNNYAMKYNYKVNNDRELTSYAAMNLINALQGGCPVNGSVSRTGIADQFGCNSQLMSVTASAVMLLVLLFGTPLLNYMPVPVLTGIVMAALIGILDIAMAKKLWKKAKNEFFIFMMAFWGVLIFGTIYGVVIGMVLSFCAVIARAVVPPRSFLGVIPGHEGVFSLKRNRSARPVAGTVLYRFSGNLFFANINTFQDDIEQALKDDTKQVIVDARGIGSIDITAADRLVQFHDSLGKRGIRFYITEHAGLLNDQLRELGAGSLLEQGAVRRTVALALRDAGLEQPYPLEGSEPGETYDFVVEKERLAEIEWAFGEDAETWLGRMAGEAAGQIAAMTEFDEAALQTAEKGTAWGRLGLFDEDEFLDHLEARLQELAREGRMEGLNIRDVKEKIEKRRRVVEEKLRDLHPEALEMLEHHREEFERYMREKHPELFDKRGD